MANGPTGGLRPALGGARHAHPVGSWILDGPRAEAVTSESGFSEKALEQRTRRTHCGRPCGGPNARGRFLSEPFFGFACVGFRGPSGVIPDANCVEEAGFFCRSCEKMDSGTDPVRF